MFPTIAEFRRTRDEEALKSYRLRWPVLKAREGELRQIIAKAEKTLDEKHLDDLKMDKQGPYYALQYVTAQLDAIERDAVIRKERLGANAWETMK